MSIHLWQFMLVSFAGWVNRQQQIVIEYLKEENRVLRVRFQNSADVKTKDGKELSEAWLMTISAEIRPTKAARIIAMSFICGN